ncbi:hypothetical protein CJ20_254 [Escherichia phage CJ20]|nr:hypothetical protein CJ20_254 [Escherichia phage CJ20]
MGLVNNGYRACFNWFILFMVSEETVMLYDPSGNSENGVIVLEPEHPVGDVYRPVEVCECNFVKGNTGGISIEQDDDVIYLDASQVEALYSILKHNR